MSRYIVRFAFSREGLSCPMPLWVRAGKADPRVKGGFLTTTDPRRALACHQQEAQRMARELIANGYHARSERYPGGSR